MEIRMNGSPTKGFLAVWFGSAFVSVILPLIIFGVGQDPKNYNGEGQQDDNQQEEDQQQYRWSPYSCSWYQWGCKRREKQYFAYQGGQQQQQQEEQRDGEVQIPFWMRWFFMTEEERRQRDEMGMPNSALIFVYCWSLALLGAVLYYGYSQIKNEKTGANFQSMVAALAVFANFTFLSLFYLGGLEGGIQTEGPEFENMEISFYGQFSVMLFLTNFFLTIFAVVFAVLFWKKHKKAGVEEVDVDGSNYTSWSLWNSDKETV